MLTQLSPPIPIDVLGKGNGLAVAIIDYGPEHNLIWVTAIDATGEVWCAPNPTVRFQQNWTMGRSDDKTDHAPANIDLNHAAFYGSANEDRTPVARGR